MTPDETERLLRARRSLTGESFNDGDIRTWSYALRAEAYGLAADALTRASGDSKRVGIFELRQALTAGATRPAEWTPPAESLPDPRAIAASDQRAVGLVQAGVGAEWAARLQRARDAGPEMLARLDRWTRIDRSTSEFAAWVQHQLHPPTPEAPETPLESPQADANADPVPTGPNGPYAAQNGTQW